jgi:hypothetical protein
MLGTSSARLHVDRAHFFIVIFGVALAGMLTVMNQVVSRSADPMLTKQAAVLADSVLEEVLQRPMTTRMARAPETGPSETA